MALVHNVQKGKISPKSQPILMNFKNLTKIKTKFLFIYLDESKSVILN